MPQVVDPSLVTLINSRAYSALQVFRRNSGNTVYEWGTGVWTDQSYADPAWLTSLNYTKVVGLGTLATQNGTFSGTSSGTNTGDQVNITGTAGNLSGTPTLPNGTAAATQGASDNSTKLATTAYADAAVATAVTGTLKFKGATDCSANPNYPAALKGDVYVVSVVGKIGGASGVAVDIGDQFLAIADNAGGTQASVGASWTILEHNLQGALLSANNLSDVASVSSSRTNLGGTTIGQSVFTLTNPSTITFPRFNADNTVTALSASSFLSAIGGGTGNGTVTAIGVTTANGVSGSSSGGATPNLTITLGNIVPTTVGGNTISTGTGTLTLSTFTLTVSGTASISGTNSGGANPSATVSTSAVNGTATTFMRSDAAPALASTISAGGPVGSGTVVPIITCNAAGQLTTVSSTSVTIPTLDAIPLAVADVSINTHKVTNVTDPTSPQDAATKNYVDLATQALAAKADCQSATTAALAAATYNNGSAGVGATLTLTVAAVLIVDGYTPVLNDRILVKNQASAVQNGIFYLSTVGVAGITNAVLTRSTDFDDPIEGINGALVYVLNGTANANTLWSCTTNVSITFGSTNINWTKFLGSTYTADETTLHLSGTTFSIISTYVGQTSVVTLGTISTGTWQATKVGLAYGGTNADLSGTGAANNFLKQSSTGAAVTVGSIGIADLAVVTPPAITRVVSTASSATPTPNADTTDEYILTALAANATFGAPTGTPLQGQKLLIRIKSDATPRTLTFNAIYRAGTIALPTTTIASKTMYLGFVFDTEDTKWDFVAYVDNL